jgi:hypothetical protein
MPQNEIRIIKSPVVPLYAPDEERIISSNELTYYVRLSNGVIATKPEDFPNDKSEKEIEEVVDS